MEAEPHDRSKNEEKDTPCASSPEPAESAHSKPADQAVQIQRTGKEEAHPKAGGKKTKRRRTVKELEAALEEERRRSEDYKRRLAYLQAEHENYIKSMERRQALMVQQANRDLVLKLLPVLDDLERALAMLPVIEVNEPSIEGLSMVVENFRSALRSVGVEPIECEGKPFDPLRHEAIARIETEEYQPNTVIEELRRGYTLHGTLLRPSLVKIAIPPSPQNHESEQTVKTTEQERSTQSAEERLQQTPQVSPMTSPSQTGSNQQEETAEEKERRERSKGGKSET